MAATRLRTVALLAQACGLQLLREVLIGREDLEVAAVFTHLRRPEGHGRERPAEVDGFRAACREADVALVFADGPEAQDIAPLLPFAEMDLLICLGWGCPVDAAALARFPRGQIELQPESSATGPGFAAWANRTIDAALDERRALP